MNPTTDLFEVTYVFWLMVFALGVCVCVGYVLRFAWGRTERFASWNRVTAIAAAIMLCLLAVDGLNLVHRHLRPANRLTGTVAVIAAAACLTWMHLKHSKTPREVFRRRVSTWFLLISSVGMAGWSSHRFHERLSPAPIKPPFMVSTPGKRSQVLEFVAVTDRNHPIKVYRLDENAAETDDPDARNATEYTGSMIQRTPAGPLANCHGWLFLGGQFLISGDAVQRILDDNDYEVVSEPMAGDIIIYRSDNQEIVHSGLVRGVLNDGTILIESKWGSEGTYLHNPMDQPYSQLYEFYHSPRHDHRVNIVPVDELPLDE